jgi:hypothetical protein
MDGIYQDEVYEGEERNQGIADRRLSRIGRAGDEERVIQDYSEEKQSGVCGIGRFFGYKV